MTLIGVDPQPVRNVEVELKVKLDRLHNLMQAIMGWTATYPDEFGVGNAGWGAPDLNDLCDGFT